MRVVVTGMGVVSPVGNNVETFWKNLLDGVCGIQKIDDPIVEELPAKVWALVKDFAPADFDIEPALARKQDKFTLYGLAAVQQAMVQSGLVAGENVDPYRLGVYFGSGVGGFETNRSECAKMAAEGPRWVSPQLIPTMITNACAGQIAIKHGANGPCFSLSTACATGTHAIGEAYRAIKHGYADAVICGGSEAACIPMSIAAFGNMRALTKSEDPQRASLPFNAKRGGFVMGDGAGALVLESYEHAVERGATILAEVTGYGSTCDAHHITAPALDGKPQAAAILQALNESGYDPSKDVLHINAHGTGTAMNDVCETAAFKLALGEDAYKAQICSIKGMIGHLLGAAGAVEAVAAVMALREGIVPATIGLDEIDPALDLDYTPLKPVKRDITLAISDSLGFGGHNACLAFRK